MADPRRDVEDIEESLDIESIPRSTSRRRAAKAEYEYSEDPFVGALQEEGSAFVESKRGKKKVKEVVLREDLVTKEGVRTRRQGIATRGLGQIPGRAFGGRTRDAISEARRRGLSEAEINEIKLDALNQQAARSARAKETVSRRQASGYVSPEETLAGQLGIEASTVRRIPGPPPKEDQSRIGLREGEARVTPGDYDDLETFNIQLNDQLNRQRMAIARAFERPRPAGSGADHFHVDRGGGVTEVYVPGANNTFVLTKTVRGTTPLSGPAGVRGTSSHITNAWETPTKSIILKSQPSESFDIKTGAYLPVENPSPSAKNYIIDLPATRAARRAEVENQGRLRGILGRMGFTLGDSGESEEPAKGIDVGGRGSSMEFANPRQRDQYVRDLGERLLRRSVRYGGSPEEKLIVADPAALNPSSPSFKKRARELGLAELRSQELRAYRDLMTAPGTKERGKLVVPSSVNAILNPETGFYEYAPQGVVGKGRITRQFTVAPPATVAPVQNQWEMAANNARLHGMPHHTFEKQWTDYQGGKSSVNPVAAFSKPPTPEYAKAMEMARALGVSEHRFFAEHQRHQEGFGDSPIVKYKTLGRELLSRVREYRSERRTQPKQVGITISDVEKERYEYGQTPMGQFTESVKNLKMITPALNPRAFPEFPESLRGGKSMLEATSDERMAANAATAGGTHFPYGIATSNKRMAQSASAYVSGLPRDREVSKSGVVRPSRRSVMASMSPIPLSDRGLQMQQQAASSSQFDVWGGKFKMSDVRQGEGSTTMHTYSEKLTPLEQHAYNRVGFGPKIWATSEYPKTGDTHWKGYPLTWVGDKPHVTERRLIQNPTIEE